MNVRVLNIVYCILVSTHLCSGSMYADHTPRTKMLTTESDLPQNSLHLLKGKECIETLDYDSARVYLLQSANSTDISVKTESYLYLNFIETRLENYDIALHYLELYHKNAMLLFHRSLDIQDSIRNHKEKIDNIIYSIDRQHRTRLYIVLFLCVSLIAIILLMIYLQQKGPSAFSKKKRDELKKLDTAIQSKKDISQLLSYNSYLLQAEIFKQTPIYSEIKELEKQKKSNSLKVLTYGKQDCLQRELDTLFENFQKDLSAVNSKLTQNDLKLCCLSLLPLNSFSKALCFGSTETNVIKQRKYYIKKKMTEESDNSLLFDFIFSTRKE